MITGQAASEVAKIYAETHQFTLQVLKILLKVSTFVGLGGI